MPNYICWTKYEKKRIIMKDGDKEEGDNNISDFAKYSLLILQWTRLKKRLQNMTILMT
jgi:hypothetical protein